MRTDMDTKTGKNVKIFIILSIILLIAFAGCAAKDQTITTPDGEVKVSQGSGSGPAWCKAGTKITSTGADGQGSYETVSYTHLRAHETRHDLVCRLLLEKKKQHPTVKEKKNRTTKHKADKKQNDQSR